MDNEIAKKPFVLGISPARGGSKGIPRKNLIDLCGKPLLAHTIEQSLNAKTLSDYLVNSEDEEIRTVAESYGAKTMSRPDMYAHDQILQEVDLLLKWTVEEYEKQNPDIHVDVVVLLYPTAPLRGTQAIDSCVRMVVEDGFDTALTLYSDSTYLWRIGDDGKSCAATNYDPNNRMPRQKENWNQWAENKAVYATRRDVLFSIGRVGPKCGFVEMEKWRSIDIDEPVDLEIARAILCHNP